MHEAITDQLSDYLDGELSASEAAAIEAHLRECAACNAVLNDLKGIVQQAQHLETRPPQADLWVGIASRIERAAPPRRVSFTLPQLAAAAAVLIAVSAGTAIKLAAPGPLSRPDGPAFVAVPPPEPAEPSTTTSVTPVSFSDAQYDAAVADLEKAVKAGRGRLDQSTIDIVEHNLQIIDQAIAQARDALAGDPANTYLSSHLVEARRRKLDLLRRTAALAETD
jgi:negative regulator of sigma E activity